LGHDRPVIGGLIIAVVLLFVLPVVLLLSGAVGSAVMGWLLKENAEATHEGSELIATNV
jgi:hypothetical protein